MTLGVPQPLHPTCLLHVHPPAPALRLSRQLLAPQKPCGTGEAGSTCLLQEDKVYREGYTDPTQGGAPTCGGQGWVTASEAWRGPQHQRCLGRSASSQGGLPPLRHPAWFSQDGQGWPGEAGRAQRLCYQGVSLRKGCDPLSSQEPLPGLGSRRRLWGPWTGWRSGLSYARTQASGCGSPGAQDTEGPHRGPAPPHLGAALLGPLSLSDLRPPLPLAHIHRAEEAAGPGPGPPARQPL